MALRPRCSVVALGALLAGACPDSVSRPPADAAVDAEPAPDAGVDAALVCGEAEAVGASHDHCLGCGLPCGDDRPFCCLGTCCAEECGQAVNDCAPDPDPTRPTEAGGGPDGCQDLGFSALNCFDCGVGCGPSRPFCCDHQCCADECGAQGNDCSDEP